MDDIFKQGEIPIGLGMALAQNTEALDRFALLSPDERKSVITGAHNVNSRQEMREYVDSIKNM